ncbi:MAG: toll/interleukin-1 receptor domain-containing protein [Phototrophicaceae bacterium]
MPAHFFISYSREQLYMAEALALRLQAQGVPLWFDIQQINAGDDWRYKIDEGLEQAQGLIFLASSSAIRSPYVETEWRTLLKRGKPLYVVMLESCALPDELEHASVTILDMRVDFDGTVTRLLQALQGQLPPRQSVPKRKLWGLPLRHPSSITLMIAPFIVTILQCLRVFTEVPYYLQTNQLGTTELAILAINSLTIYFFLSQVIAILRRTYTFNQYWILLLFALGSVNIYGGLVIEADVWLQVLLVALAGFVYFRTESAYRWLPTGQAPQWMRKRFGMQKLPTLANLGSQLDRLDEPRHDSFMVHASPADQRTAEHVAQALVQQGHLAVEEAHAQHHIVILSNTTPERLLVRVMKQYPYQLIPVLGSGVILPPQFTSLTAHQYIDFRQHAAEQLNAIGILLRHPQKGKIIYGLNMTPRPIEKHIVPRGIQRFSVGMRLLMIVFVWNAIFTLMTDFATNGRVTDWWTWLQVVGVMGASVVGATVVSAVNQRRLSWGAFVGVMLLGLPLWYFYGLGLGVLVVMGISAQAIYRWLPRGGGWRKAEATLKPASRANVGLTWLRDAITVAVFVLLLGAGSF